MMMVSAEQHTPLNSVQAESMPGHCSKGEQRVPECLWTRPQRCPGRYTLETALPCAGTCAKTSCRGGTPAGQAGPCQCLDQTVGKRSACTQQFHSGAILVGHAPAGKGRELHQVLVCALQPPGTEKASSTWLPGASSTWSPGKWQQPSGHITLKEGQRPPANMTPLS